MTLLFQKLLNLQENRENENDLNLLKKDIINTLTIDSNNQITSN